MKKSLRQRADAVGEHALGVVAGVGAQHAQAADEDGHLRGGEAEQVGAVDQAVLAGQAALLAEHVAEAVGRSARGS